MWKALAVTDHSSASLLISDRELVGGWVSEVRICLQRESLRPHWGRLEASHTPQEAGQSHNACGPSNLSIQLEEKGRMGLRAPCSLVESSCLGLSSFSWYLALGLPSIVRANERDRKSMLLQGGGHCCGLGIVRESFPEGEGHA